MCMFIAIGEVRIDPALIRKEIHHNLPPQISHVVPEAMWAPMATPSPVPLDVVGEIASYTSRPTLLQLFLVSRATQAVVRRYLYRHIVVRNRKHRELVLTLASDGALPPLVHTLKFQWTEYCGRVWGPSWDRVLIGMTNLMELTVADHVQLSHTARQGITFTLKYFSTSAAILGNWSLFLQNQPTIELLELEVTLAGTMPVLPNLKRAILAPSIAAKLLEVNTIPELIFYPTFPHNVRTIPRDDISLFTCAQPGLLMLRLRCKQFLNLLAAPNIFAQLKHLVLDDDKTWRSDPLISNPRAVSYHLNSKLVLLLSTLRMVSSDTRPSFSKICRAVAERGFLPALHNMHYCCPRGCHNWTRSAEEMAIYVECDHCEGSFLEGHIEETSDWPDNTDSETDTYVDWDYARWGEIDADAVSRIDNMSSPSMNPALARALEPGATRVRRKNPAAGEDRLWPLAEWLTEVPVWSPLPSRHRLRSQDPIVAAETTLYTRMGPETPIEKEWRISMQGVADLAEEWVAEGEAKWQADYQLLADWSRARYGCPLDVCQRMAVAATDTSSSFRELSEAQAAYYHKWMESKAESSNSGWQVPGQPLTRDIVTDGVRMNDAAAKERYVGRRMRAGCLTPQKFSIGHKGRKFVIVFILKYKMVGSSKFKESIKSLIIGDGRKLRGLTWCLRSALQTEPGWPEETCVEQLFGTTRSR
ncbi:hypothetical protein C8J57DRAFT_1650109 [Mycena rebaudengoi]|nr:hypothetical protein C8J57DRAFT_1650109 [Mycena rebaudengoi]